jgi:hypothetical protein
MRGSLPARRRLSLLDEWRASQSHDLALPESPTEAGVARSNTGPSSSSDSLMERHEDRYRRRDRDRINSLIRSDL